MFNIENYKKKEIFWIENYKKSKIIQLNENLNTYDFVKKNKIQKIEQYRSYESNKINRINAGLEKKILNNKKKIDRINKFSLKAIEKCQNRKDRTFLQYKTYQLFRPYSYIQIINQLINFLNKNKLLTLVALISIFAGASIDVFFTKQNILGNIFKQNIETGIMAIGMTFVILTGGIDLSVGSMLGFLGIFISKAYVVDHYALSTSIILGLSISILLGLFQGILIGKMKLPPFIVTLVGLLGYRGLSKILAHSKTFTVENNFLAKLNTDSFIGIPDLIWILIIVFFISFVVLKFTKFGRNIYATGGNKEAAKLSGVKIGIILSSVYLIAAILVLIATISYTSRVGSINPNTGTSMELNVISIVVLGGTSLSGGKGGVGKTILGWLVISTLSNVLNLLGYQDSWQLLVKGIIILSAVMLDKEYNFLKRIKKFYIRIF